MKQERTTHDWMQDAKDLAAAERELKIEKWVYITFYKRTGSEGRVELLYRYDLPRQMWLRYQWVISWRLARFTCLYPRNGVYHTLSFYDKRTGANLEIGSLLRRLASAKAWITKCERRIGEYCDYHRKNNLFFEEQTDEILIKALGKLEQKRQKARDLEIELQRETDVRKRIFRVVKNTV